MEEQIQETEVVEEGLGGLMPQGGNAMTSIENAANPGIPIGNIIEQQETARGLSEVQLIELAKSPDPSLIPPYLVTSELMRRKTVREKAQAKAPQATVAQDAVNNAEQGIMSQMQRQAPTMPPGGFVPPMQRRVPQQQRRPQMNPGIMGQMQQQAPQRPGGVTNVRPQEVITREQIMERGVPTLPNPGNRLGQGGMAQGGIIGFAAGGYQGPMPGSFDPRFTDEKGRMIPNVQGYYMPKVKGKGAIANLQYAPEREPENFNPYIVSENFNENQIINTSQGLYQDFPIGDYESYAKEIAGLGADKGDLYAIEDIQETFETPYDSEIARLKESISSGALSDGTKVPQFGAKSDSGSRQSLVNQLADMEYQKSQWFKGESDNLIKQRGMRNPESNQGFVYDETIKEQIVKPQGNGLPGAGGEIKSPPPGLGPNNLGGDITKGYNRFNPAGGPVEPAPNLTVKQYQKDLAEANAAFGLESAKDYYAAQRKLVGEEKAELLEDKQDYTNLNMIQTGFKIAQTGDIFGQGAEGIQREVLNTKDAKKLKKISEKEERAIKGMERAEISGDAKGYMKERKVQKEQQLAAIKLNMDAYGDYLKSQADRFGKRGKDWIDALNWAEKTVKGDGNLAARYAGPNGMALYKKNIYEAALEAYNNPGRMPSKIAAYSDMTPKEAGKDIRTSDSYWSS